MRQTRRPDQHETESRIERARLQELRVRRASPLPDARDAYDDLKSRILHLLTQDLGLQETSVSPVSHSTIQAKLDLFLAEEKIILKRHEKRQLTNDILVELADQQRSPRVRKTPGPFYTLAELSEAGMLTSEAAAFLEEAVLARSNIIISGQARTGKTTLLRALCQLIPIEEQLVTIEESAELLLDRQNLVSLEIETAINAHKPQIPLQSLLMTSARMHPDRIILESIHGSTAYTWLQLIDNDLHGSMATCLAENPEALLAHIESMILEVEPKLAMEHIRRQIASAVDLVIHLEKQAECSPQIVKHVKITVHDGSEFVLVDAM